MALTQGKDFYYDEQGRMVLTSDYLLNRGHCCQSGCQNCPYGFSDKVDPSFPAEFQDPWNNKKEKAQSDWVYNPDEDDD